MHHGNSLLVALPSGSEEQMLTAIEGYKAGLQTDLTGSRPSDDDRCYVEINLLECDERAMMMLAHHGPPLALIAMAGASALLVVGLGALIHRRRKAAAAYQTLKPDSTVEEKWSRCATSSGCTSAREPEAEESLESGMHATATSESEP